MTDIGIDLDGVAYFGTEYPFVDRFKTSGGWTAHNDSGWMSAAVSLDANGYPTGLPAGATAVATEISVDPTSTGHDDLYDIFYTGKADFNFTGTVVSSEPGKIVVKAGDDGAFSYLLMVLSNIDSSDPVTAIHVVRDDQLALYQQGEIFNPAFVDKITPFDTLRMKDWAHTDGSIVTSWSQRSTMDSASWAATDGQSGVPIEVQVKLANQTHNDLWINIPAQADDDYVRQTLSYVHDHLDPSLKVTVEYSNEVWNWAFPQASYAAAQGDRLWGVDANHDGTIDANDKAEHVGDGFMQYYGYRSAQIATIAKSIYGSDADARLNDVLSTQFVYEGLENSILAGVAKAGDGSVSQLFGSYAVAPYFGGELDGATAADQAKVLAWARGGSGGVDAAFHELEYGGGGFSSDASLAALQQFFTYQGKVAAQNGLSLVTYEAGVDLVATHYDPSVQGEIIAFFEKLADDPRMGQLYTKMIAELAAAGGTMLTQLGDAGTPTVYGSYGALNSIYDDGSPRYDALVAAAGQDTGPVATALASYTLAVAGTDLSYTGHGAFAGTGNALANVITGGGGNDVLHGLAGDDTLRGLSGNDVLDGGTGADRMIGGNGDDLYYVDNVHDGVTERAGGGTDEVRTTLAAYALPANVETLTFIGSGDFAGTGNALANLITGGDGNDVLDGGAGADRMIGGAGNDRYIVDDAGDVVVEQPGGGTDEVDTALASYTLPANVERLVYTAAGGAAPHALVAGTLAGTGLSFDATGNAVDNVIVGSTTGANHLAGLDGNDTLTGGSGNDVLDGGSGADRLVGGGGDDTYIVDNAGDIVVEAANGGNDLVVSGVDYSLTSTVEQLRLTGAAVKGTGNALDNVITGNDAANLLQGARGNDTLFGAGGDDRLGGDDGNDQAHGGDGADYLDGGAGDDMLWGDAGNDTLIGGAGRDTVYGGAGADRFIFKPGDLMPVAAGAPAGIGAADLIGDFSHAEGDRIDLSALDALLGGGARHLAFIGANAFGHHAGELRLDYHDGYYEVTGDLDGDGQADFHLNVATAISLMAGDFVL